MRNAWSAGVRACLQGSERKRESMGVLNFSFYACKGAHTLFTDQREGEREKEEGREREREREREKEIDRKREREKERERKR